MKIDQLLYGYRNGHRLITGSLELNESMNWELVRATDRPSVSEKELDSGITFGFTLNENYYALCRTWSAKEVDRPGAVWTHVLLLSRLVVASPLNFLPLLHQANEPNEEEFRQPKIFLNQYSADNIPTLTIEAARLLMLFAAKPMSGLRVYSNCTPPLELLGNAQFYWSGILYNQSFSTSLGKKNIVADKKSVIVIADDSSINSSLDSICLSEQHMKIPSERITRSWNILHESETLLKDWLLTIGQGIEQTTSNLKLVLEVLLLGTEELDDYKLLQRIDGATTNSDAPILSYSIGKSPIQNIQAPPTWVAALFLMGEESWEKWSNLISASAIGIAAASAPIKFLAERLLNLSHNSETKIALNKLSHAITENMFQTLYHESESAAAILVKENPDLLFTLPRVDRRNVRLAEVITGQDIPWELDLLSRAPFWWRPAVGKLIRFRRHQSDLNEYAKIRISDGTWPQLTPEIQKFLRETPDLIDYLLYSDPSHNVIKFIFDEFSATKLKAAIERLLTNDDEIKNKLANYLVEIFGPAEAIPVIKNMSEDNGSLFVAAVADARWHLNDSKKVLKRIKSDIDAQENPSIVIDFIENKKLLKALDLKKEEEEPF